MKWKILFGIAAVFIIVAVIGVIVYKYDKCDYGNPDRRYVAHSVSECSVIKYACKSDEDYFHNDCGCGCMQKLKSNSVKEEDIDLCNEDSDCIIVKYSHCCGLTKKAINKNFADEYYKHENWQKFDDPEVCSIIGRCPDDSKVNSTECKDMDGKKRCSLKY